MLPQKLGLDVLIEEGTEKLVTVEINGENSGYQGLKDLGVDPTPRIYSIYGNALRGKEILVSPAFLDMLCEKECIPYLQKFRQEYKIAVTFSPFLGDIPFTQEEFEKASGISLDRFAGILGLGKALRNYEPARMINTPWIELLADDKFIQYEILKDIPELNFPDTLLFDCLCARPQINQFKKTYSTLVLKKRDGSLGKDVSIIQRDSELSNISTEYDELYTKLYIKALRDHGLGGVIELTNGPLLFNFVPAYLEKIRVKKPEEANSYIKERIADGANCYILQKFIPSKPIRSKETGKEHHARARLLWCGEYLGGYWTLSQNPISDKTSQNKIVNYCTTKTAQKFNPGEERLFKQYAETVVPKILQKAEQHKQDLTIYEKIEEQKLREFMLRDQTPKEKANTLLDNILGILLNVDFWIKRYFS